MIVELSYNTNFDKFGYRVFHGETGTAVATLKGRFAEVNVSLADSASTASKLLVATQSVGMDPQTGGTPSTPYLAYLGSLTDRTDSVPESYFYHPDHLGSASWITEAKTSWPTMQASTFWSATPQ